jgi:hypothetical protein
VAHVVSPEDLVRGVFAALDAKDPAAVTARMTDDVRMRLWNADLVEGKARADSVTGESDSDVARRKLARFRQAIAGAGLVEADPAFSAPLACFHSNRSRLDSRSASGGVRDARERTLDGRTGYEPHELHTPARRHRGQLRSVAGRTDRGLPRSMGRDGLAARAARFGPFARRPRRAGHDRRGEGLVAEVSP